MYHCEFCQKRFCRVLAFEKHRATHTGLPVAVRCGQVDCDFTYSSVLQRKVLRKFEILDINFSNNSSIRHAFFKNHMVQCHTEQIFPCSVCSKVFFTKWNLSYHMVIINF